MIRIITFPKLHPAQVEHTAKITGFLERLRDQLGPREAPDAEKHQNCAAVPGSLECDNALTTMCETCPWWVAQTEEP